MTWTFVESSRQGAVEVYGSLYARVRNRGKNRKYCIGYTIKKHEWEKLRKMQYIGSTNMTSIGMTYANFANILSRIKCALENEELSSDAIRSVIESIKSEFAVGVELPVVDAPDDSKPRLLNWLKTYHEDLESGKRLKRQHTEKVSKGYLYGVRQLVNCVAEFQAVKNVVLALDQVTMSFQKDFILFLKEKNYKPNTISGIMQILRTTMEMAYFEKQTKVDEFRHPAFVPRAEEVDNVYLTPEQIEQLMNLDLSSAETIQSNLPPSSETEKEALLFNFKNVAFLKKLQLARDVFLVGCFTGQRFSDYSRIGTKMIREWDGNKFIVIRQKKTGTKVYIPLDVRVKQILEKYGGELPGISSKTLNKDIKFLGFLLGWTYVPEFDGKDTLEIDVRFCDMLSSHTARRSFATNAYAAGIPLSSIMAITGHQSELNLRKYLKLNAEEKGTVALRDLSGFVKMEEDE